MIRLGSSLAIIDPLENCRPSVSEPRETQRQGEATRTRLVDDVGEVRCFGSMIGKRQISSTKRGGGGKQI